MYNGMVDKGLAVVKAARDRYNGLHRNPWDEEECGHHYARAMSSWALLLALSGFHYDGVKGVIGFAPAVAQKQFASFWSCGSGWGTVSIRERKRDHVVDLTPLYGALRLTALQLPGKRIRPGGAELTRNGVPLRGSGDVKDYVTVRCSEPVVLEKGDTLRVAY
jgi:hypothetical protein